MVNRIKIQVDSEEDASADFFDTACDRGWTDGLPVIPPTPERVEGMLATVERDPQEVVAILPPRQGPATVESLAVNAVMAGCRPEYFPVVVAAVEAIGDPRFPRRTLSGHTLETPFLLINGPIRREININCETACLGPGRRANATIGRALQLIMINVGGGIPDGVISTNMSSPLHYTFCAGENEEESPWEPFHMEHGYKKEQSVVTAFRATSYIALLAPLDYWDESVEGILSHTAGSMVSPDQTALYGGNLCALLLVTPERAQFFAQEGLSKADVKARLCEKASLPLSVFRPGVRQTLEELGRVKSDKVTMFDRPDEIHIVVMGGPGIYSIFIPGFSHEVVPTAPVGKLISTGM